MNRRDAADRRVGRRLDRRRSTTTRPQAAQFRNILINKYGYDPGGLGDFNGDDRQRPRSSGASTSTSTTVAPA